MAQPCTAYTRAVLLLLLLATAAWTRPELPVKGQPPAAADQRLDYMVIQVGGEAHLVHVGEELPILRGDQVEVKEARLVAPGRAIESVHVYGLVAAGGTGGGGGRDGRHRDDRRKAFPTHQLKARYSEAGQGGVFAVVATTGEVLHGAVYLHLVDPVLRYAVLSLNGSKHLLRDGETLRARKVDKVKVEEVVTNLATSSDVAVQIKPAAEAGHFAFEFSRDGQVFARIGLLVVD